MRRFIIPSWGDSSTTEDVYLAAKARIVSDTLTARLGLVFGHKQCLALLATQGYVLCHVELAEKSVNTLYTIV